METTGTQSARLHEIPELEIAIGELPEGFARDGSTSSIPGEEAARTIMFVSGAPQAPGSPLSKRITITRIDDISNADLRASTQDPSSLVAAVSKAWNLSGVVRSYPAGLAMEIEEASRVSGALGPDASFPDRVTRQTSVFLDDGIVLHVLGEGVAMEALRAIAECATQTEAVR